MYIFGLDSDTDETGRGGITPQEGRKNMTGRIIERSIDFHVEQRTLHRSFDTLEAAQKFAEGKTVIDIFRSQGRFKVEYLKTKRVDYVSRIIYDGEEITPETAMKWFCWHEIVSAMEKQKDAIKNTADYMNAPHNRNVPDWEYRFLKTFLEFAKEDLVID